jgi:transcriptional regulator with XRE-family HTH domain
VRDQLKASEDLVRTYSTRLRAMVSDCGLSQPTLVKASGVARETLYRYLHGNANEVPTIAIVAKIAYACGYEVEIQFRKIGSKAKSAAPEHNLELIDASESRLLEKYQERLEKERLFSTAPGLKFPTAPIPKTRLVINRSPKW